MNVNRFKYGGTVTVRKMINLLLSLSLVLMTACMTGCAQKPIEPAGADESYETVSGTIRLEVSSEGDDVHYPPEFPSADDQPPLDNLNTTARESQNGRAQPDTAEAISIKNAHEVRAVWFSYLEFQKLLTGRNEQQFKANIEEAFDRVKSTGFNTVFVQVRPFGDAFYKSDYFPWSYIVTGEESKDPGFDPLAVMIEQARSRGLRIEAWINPYRIRTDDKKELSADNPAQLWLDREDEAVLRYGSGIYYNPGSEKARELIVKGVKEIVQQYDVDGIHFDDYFYPTDSAKFDQSTYETYRAQGGKLSMGNWRRENVNQLVREVYAAIKECDPTVLFGISPQGNNENNYDGQFIDTAKWLSSEGYVDYICPQIYFGFENSKAPFERTVQEWDSMIKIDSIQLYVGLASYKIGLNDQWAGAGEKEWAENSDMLARMVQSARGAEHYGGVAFFRYQSLYEPDSSVDAQVQTELSHLEKVF